MATTRQRLKQIHPPDAYDDTLVNSEVVDVESNGISLEEVVHAFLSQLKHIINGSESGNWYDDVETKFSSNVCLRVLNPDNIMTDSGEVLVDSETGNVLTEE